MRYFIHIGKSMATVSFQVCARTATFFRKGIKRGAIIVRGMVARARGFGWYKMVVSSNQAPELVSAMSYLKGREHNLALLDTKPTNVEVVAARAFAFEHGLFGQQVASAFRILKVGYVSRAGRSFGHVINRAEQASEGLHDFMCEAMKSVMAKQVSDSKLAALQAKFSH